ncbi:alpha/beta fold hydrolase [Massilia rhizosphaerae]|uniref:alpha/beta fold hydrolase n=1 Tax=Massilia rhizosphaerae TaxID=2784389 RepID=UPI0018DDD0E0|nr:alpha/beta hydrolase [Massilia rhizosphaerae]
MNILRNKAALAGIFVALVLCGHHDSRAADAAPEPNRYAAAIAPAERFEVGGVLVERHGSGGRPLILIPGLASGSWVWQETIRAFAPDHAVYVLTLPGFDGRPPAGPAPFAAARAAVEELIAKRHLDKPVIVGHSLGGILALAVAEDKPSAPGGIVSIDGLPVMPGTEDMTPMQRAQFADKMRLQVGSQPPDRFAQQQQAYMRTIGVMDMSQADALARLTAKSDPKSVGAWAADVLTLDLRPGLKTIQAPVLAIVPYLDLDSAQQGLTPAAKADYYRALMEGTPKLQVVTVAPSRHFAMFDQPQAVVAAIRTFLGTL